MWSSENPSEMNQSNKQESSKITINKNKPINNSINKANKMNQ